MARISESELILNPDGSIYHLHLRPEDIARNIITVGDPERVPMVSKYFDLVEVKKEKREFVSHTGRIGKKRFTVISTGIGTDNIDVALNELDALVNIDLETREARKAHRSLNIVRMGTSGSIHEDIPAGQFVASAYGLGLDNLMSYYHYQPNLGEAELTDGFREFLSFKRPLPFYACEGSPGLLRSLGKDMHQGITLTSPGFYGPQGRILRAPGRYDADFFRSLSQFKYQNYPITNFEMETSAIYGLCRLLGHQALSTNVIIANRRTGAFSKDPKGDVDRLIRKGLEAISESDLIE